ncbi:MAG: triose-phosphate isomerase [Calditrichaeota bacterium]|nr:MAG: triose-phosphate isomerase [Calditrichota bacterium]
MRQKVIAGNWKMHKTVPEAVRLARQLRARLEKHPPLKTRVIVCPPATNLYPLKEVLQGSGMILGAQNIFWEEEGAYTGEVSAAMVKSAGAAYVIIGHSERRRYFKEDASIINKKIRLALNHKLKVIHCVGETLEEREQNLTRDIVLNQIEWDLKDISPEQMKNVIIAYEPVWAIGTGKTATPEQAQEVHRFIREMLDALFKDGLGKRTTILYGGSVKPENARGLLSQPDIDGALVGGACLQASSFFKIIQASESVG